MTDETVARHGERGNTEWTEAEARYRTASEALEEATNQASGGTGDVNDAAVMAHAAAARALIETPATHLAHIAVKIRAADNLLDLTASYPELPKILLDDIFGLLGLYDPDGAALPPSI